MEQLQTLHMSSNGLTGTIGDIGSTNLVDISLSNNDLVGSIPSSLQEYEFLHQLDLSNNKLSGVLDVHFQVNQSGANIDLTVNRLSGQIPSDLYPVKQLNILDGNLFQCQMGDMPQNDPNKKSQECGSKNFNNAMIVWATMAILVLGLYFLLPSDFVPDFMSFHRFINDENSFFARHFLTVSLSNTQHYMTLLNRLTAPVLLITLFAISLGVITFISLKTTGNSDVYSTHSRQYAWTMTAAFLHDTGPAVLVIFYFLLSILIMNNILCYFTYQYFDKSYSNTNFRNIVLSDDDIAESMYETMRKRVRKALTFLKPSKEVLLQSALVLVHTVVTITVNVFYVFALLDSHLGSNVIIVIQLLLSLFKLSWIHFMTTVLKRIAGISRLSRLIVYSILYLISFVAGPFIAAFFSEDTCFHQLVEGQENVVSQFTVSTLVCQNVCLSTSCTVDCGFQEQLLMTTSVQPSWIYSFQCSSTLLVDYVPVFILSYALSGLVMPMIAIISSTPLNFIDGLLLLDEPWRYWPSELLIGAHIEALSSDISRNTLSNILASSFWSSGINSEFNQIFRISTRESSNSAIIQNNPTLNSEFRNSEVGQIIDDKSAEKIATAVTFQTKESTSSEDASNDFDRSTKANLSVHKLHRIFDSSNIIAKFFMNWTVLLTFGLTSPILALTIAVDTFAMLLLWRITIRRCLMQIRIGAANETIPVGDMSALPSIVSLQRLEDSSQVSLNGIQYCIYLMLVACSWFWSLFIFDMIGDVYGIKAGGITVLVFILLSPLILRTNNEILWRWVHVPPAQSDSEFGTSPFSIRKTNSLLQTPLISDVEQDKM